MFYYKYTDTTKKQGGGLGEVRGKKNFSRILPLKPQNEVNKKTPLMR